MNNYQKIKNMTLDEMARFLEDKISLPFEIDIQNKRSRLNYIKQWLQQESEEELIYMLRESSKYANCYFVEAFRTKEEAVKSIDSGYNYKFIAGEELKLSLTEIAESEG